MRPMTTIVALVLVTAVGARADSVKKTKAGQAPLTATKATAAPPSSKEPERRMARGRAAFKAAKTPDELKDAAKEFQLASEAAPSWPDPVFNLGQALEKAGDPAGAKRAYERYLELAPKAPDAMAVQEKVYELEFLAEKKQREKERVEIAGDWAWDFDRNTAVEVRQDGNEFTGNEPHGVLFKATLSGRDFKGTMPPGTYRAWSSDIQGRVSDDNRRMEYRYSTANVPSNTRHIFDPDGDGWSTQQVLVKKP